MNLEAVEIGQESGHQIIAIPDNLKINDDKVYIKKVGNSLFIIPYHKPWDAMINSLSGFTPDFMEERSKDNFEGREPLSE